MVWGAVACALFCSSMVQVQLPLLFLRRPEAFLPCRGWPDVIFPMRNTQHRKARYFSAYLAFGIDTLCSEASPVGSDASVKKKMISAMMDSTEIERIHEKGQPQSDLAPEALIRSRHPLLFDIP